MNIKKIIREELDDLSWMDDISILDSELTFADMYDLLVKTFNDTKYYVDGVRGHDFDIRDNTGLYDSFLKRDYGGGISINTIIKELRISSDHTPNDIMVDYNRLADLIEDTAFNL